MKYTHYYSMGLVGYELCVDNNGETIRLRYMWFSGAKPTEQRAKVRETARGRTYFLVNGSRIHFDNCLRINL